MRTGSKYVEIGSLLVFLVLYPLASSADSITIPSLGLGASSYGTTFNGNAGQGASLSSEYTYAFSPDLTWITGKALDVTYSVYGEVKRMRFNSLAYGTLTQNDATLYRGGATSGRKFGTFAVALGASLGNEVLFSTSGQYATRADVGTTLAPKTNIRFTQTLLFHRAKELNIDLDGGYFFGSKYQGFGTNFGFNFSFINALQYSLVGSYSFQRLTTPAGKQSVSEVFLGMRFTFLGEDEDHLYLEGMNFL